MKLSKVLEATALGLGLLGAGCACAGVSNPERMFTVRPIAVGAKIVLRIPHGGMIRGIRWYNNDDRVIFPTVCLYEALSEEEYKPGEKLWEGTNISGGAATWSEIAVEAARLSVSGKYYVVFEIQGTSPYSGLGSGGGMGIGCYQSGGADEGYLVIGDAVVGRLRGQAAVEVVGVEGAKRNVGRQDVGRGSQLAVSTWPNPAMGGAEIHYLLPRSGLYRLEVYDLRGRLVRTVRAGNGESGTYVMKWAGDDDLGRRLPSGTYYARLVFGGQQTTVKVVLVR